MSPHTQPPPAQPLAQGGQSSPGLLLAIAAAVALAAALFSALGPPLPSFGANSANSGGDDQRVAVWVNGTPIYVHEWQRAVQSLASDRRELPAAEDQQRILETLIREEMLVQKGTQLGLVESDHLVRNNLVSAMLQRVIESASIEDADEATLMAFYSDNPQLMRERTLLRVRHFSLPAQKPEQEALVAQTTAQLQQGVDYDRVLAELGDSANIYVPSSWLSSEQLLRYLGPTLTAAAEQLQVGDIAGPLSAREAAHFVWLLDKRRQSRPSFAEMRPQIAAEWRKRQEEKTVDAYMEYLRRRTDIRFGSDLANDFGNLQQPEGAMEASDNTAP